ncbi:MAG: hypothetical protein JSR77_12545 [Planctomycetes bacterium]|nr:hypothetical protein [Planctomycetota bacterium]
MEPSVPTPFAPSPAQVEELLVALTNPESSLSDVAVEFRTTLPALVGWLNLPEAQERLSNIADRATQHARFVANNHLIRVLNAALRIVETYEAIEKRVAVNLSSLSHIENRRRAAETARRAGALVLRIARLPNFSAAIRPPRLESPRHSIPAEAPDLALLLQLLNSHDLAPHPAAPSEQPELVPLTAQAPEAKSQASTTASPSANRANPQPAPQPSAAQSPPPAAKPASSPAQSASPRERSTPARSANPSPVAHPQSTPAAHQPPAADQSPFPMTPPLRQAG